MSMGDVIKAARLRLNWTQDELAARLATTKATISRWEANKKIPPITKLRDLSACLGVSTNDLFLNFESSSESMLRKTEASVAQNVIDPVLLAAWQKLTPKQRKKLAQIALILSEN